jgi:hypothetical protein
LAEIFREIVKISIFIDKKREGGGGKGGKLQMNERNIFGKVQLSAAEGVRASPDD